MQHIVGLTGLIGSGKSLAAQYFAQCGVFIIDTDQIAHQITAPNGLAIASIAEQFGSCYLTQDGALDRVAMRNLVFLQPDKRLLLESILHPLIFAQVLDQLVVAKSLYSIVVVPLLFKADKYLHLIRRSIFVNCQENILIERIRQRSGLLEHEVRPILAAQLSANEQLQLADDILENSGSQIELFKQVQNLHDKYKSLFEQVN
ncbi:MAG: dephospho-CoA kinase [Burkholderiales bacterium]